MHQPTATTPVPAAPPRSSDREWLTAAAVGLAMFAILAVQIQDKVIDKKAEARTVVCAREMIASGNYVIPTEGGKPRFQKPPLAYWLIAGSTRLFGGFLPNGTAAYLPSLLGGATLLVLVWGWTRRLIGGTDPFLPIIAPLIAIAFPVVFNGARSTEAEIGLAFCIIGAARFLQLSAESEAAPRRHLLIAYLFMAGGFLTKGPFALIMPLLPYAVIYRSQLAATWRWHLLGLLLALTPTLAWALACYLYDPTVFAVFYAEMIAKRVGGSTHHGEPFYFYVGVIAANVQFLLPLAALAVWGAWRAGRPHRYLIAFAGLNLLWLSLMHSKQDHYVVPIFPALAILMGWWMAGTVHHRYLRIFAWVTGILLAIAWAGAGLILMPHSLALLIAGLVPIALICHFRHRLHLPGIWLGVACFVGILHFADVFTAISAQHLIGRQLLASWLRAQPIPAETIAYVGDPDELTVYYWGEPFATVSSEQAITDATANILVTDNTETLELLLSNPLCFPIRTLSAIKRKRVVPKFVVVAKLNEATNAYRYRFAIIPAHLEPDLPGLCDRVPELMAATGIIPLRNPFTVGNPFNPFAQRRAIAPYWSMLQNGIDMPTRFGPNASAFAAIWFHDAITWGAEPGPVISRDCFAGRCTIRVLDGHDLAAAHQELDVLGDAGPTGGRTFVLIQDAPAVDDSDLRALEARLDEWGMIYLNPLLASTPDCLAHLTISMGDVVLEFRDRDGTIDPTRTRRWPMP